MAASGTTLREIFGVGPIVAAMLIGYSGDPPASPPRPVRGDTGTAPLEFSSGGRITHRLSRRGNRRLHHVLHIAAITQIRNRHSVGRGYYDRKLTDGHTRAKRSAAEAWAQRHRLAAPRRRRPTRRTAVTSGPGQDIPGRL